MGIVKHQADTPGIAVGIIFQPGEHAEKIVAVCFEPNGNQIVLQTLANDFREVGIGHRHAIPRAVSFFLLFT